MTKRMDLTDYLAKILPRDEPDTPLSLGDPDRTIVLERPEDIQAAAVAMMVLERLAGASSTKVSTRVIRDIRQRLTAAFSAKDVMAMEVEAYNALSWLVGIESPGSEHEHLDPHNDEEPEHRVVYDPAAQPLDLIRRAILEEFDLDMTYYTQSRGQLNRRRITPLHVEAETYLHAYCHARREERVFRLSRIGSIRPLDGLASRDQAKKKGQGELDLDSDL